MKKIIVSILILINLLLLNSCHDYHEIHEISYVVSIGFDYDIESNEFMITYYIINSLNYFNTTVGMAEPDVLAYTANAKSKMLTKAINDIQENTSIFLEFQHLKTIVIKETFFINDNAYLLMNFFQTNPLFANAFEIFITDSEINDIFLINNTSENNAFFTILTGKKKTNEYLKVTFLDFATDLLNPSVTEAYPILTVNKNTFKKQEKNYFTCKITGYSYIKNDYALSTFKFNNFEGLKYIFPLTNHLLKVDNNHYLITNYNCFKKIKKGNNQNKLIISITTQINIITNSQNLSDDVHRILLEEFFIKNINSFYQTSIDEQIDLFDINRLLNEKNLLTDNNYYDYTPEFIFNIIIK